MEEIPTNISTNLAEEQIRRKKMFDDYMASEEIKNRIMSRLQLNDAGEKDLESRAIIWNLCVREDNPAEGCVFFIENFGWTIDPRREPSHIPFILFPYQKEAIISLVDHIDGHKDLLLEKSRDMGVTWLVCWVFIWYWLFRDGSNLLVGSYKEKLSFDGTIDSIMGKVQYGVKTLPNWLLPEKFNPKKHITTSKVLNPINNNIINGDTMNPDFGRGARKTAIFYDELGFWDYAKASWSSGGDTTPCRIANSTPCGINFYHKLRHSDIDVITLHWRKHPLKDEAWYEFEKSRRTPEEVAQELDISYNKSLEGRVYPEWDNVRFEYHEYNEKLPLYVGWDFGLSDDTAIIWVQPNGSRLVVVDSYSNSGKNIDFYIPFVSGLVPSNDQKYTKSDLEIIDKHRSWKRGMHFGDPAGRFRSQASDRTVISALAEYGINVNFRDEWKTFQNRRRAAKHRILSGVEVVRNEHTEEFHTAMQQSSYQKVIVNGMDAFRSEKPVHNSFSHYRSAFEYLCLGIESVSGKQLIPKESGINSNRFTSRGIKRRTIFY